MTFLKYSNNQIIHPYNPSIDYPTTSFPAGYDYPEFDIYWVYPTSPDTPDGFEPIQITPMFNENTQRWEQQWDYIPKVEPVIVNWDNFNVTMMSNPRFNQVYNQCLSVAPIVANSLPVAMDQLTTKGDSLFKIIWGQLTQIGGATQEDKELWASFAIENNLPQDFIDILLT